jgi:hypothetical protein
MTMEDLLARWLRAFRANPEEIASLLSPTVTFHSPVMFRPQEGLEAVMPYLRAAHEVLVAVSDGRERFAYTRTFLGTESAMLEFVTVVGDIVVNGVDVLVVGADGLIEEIRVFLRPMRALGAVAEAMGERLANS